MERTIIYVVKLDFLHFPAACWCHSKCFNPPTLRISSNTNSCRIDLSTFSRLKRLAPKYVWDKWYQITWNIYVLLSQLMQKSSGQIHVLEYNSI